MMYRLSVALLLCLALVGCATQPSSPPEKQEKAHGAEQALSAPKPEPKQCSDYYSPQDLVGVDLTAADRRSLDPDGDGIMCNHKGVQFKMANAAQGEGIPAYEVTEAPGNIPGVRSVEILADTRARYMHEY
jgi:hypothetical protein